MPGHAAPGVPARSPAPGLAGLDAERKRAAAAARAEGAAGTRRGRGGQHRGQLGRPAPVDTLGLEVGYRLIALVDKARQGDLLGRIKGVRKKFAQDVGFLPPPVHIRDNLELKPSVYRVTLRGAVVGEGEAFPGQWLAINPGGATQPAARHQDHRPGLRPARGVDRGAPAETAQMSRFTVVDCDRRGDPSFTLDAGECRQVAGPGGDPGSSSSTSPSWPPS
jgi:flagellar biosynthesis protein FlhA